ncbi:CobW family GTP-binding protein [Amaricoccus tamworthensis]|uniref:CobW family GTP-binding protein n=1 Tax=Amaricoccus tamworthensis TaxID=57002 RepID=UPI003C7BEC18
MALTDEDRRVPVTLLTGFLGAGKTTVLNHLIRDPDAGRIAVIMNEFGDVGLDHDLIEEATEETVLLQSGCLCCTILGDLAKTLGALIAKKAAGKIEFDRVVIEASGISDPGPILHTLVADRLIAATYRLDGVVTLADAVNGVRTLDTQSEALQQIAMADLIILTKTDLVGSREIATFEVRLNAINSTARHLRATHGRVPPGSLFGLSAMRNSVSQEDILTWLGTSAPKANPLAGLSGFAPKQKPPSTLSVINAPEQSRHDHRITTASIEVKTPISERVFDFWLDTLIAMRGPDILRMKGIVHVEEMDFPFVFHGVQHIFDAPVPLKSWAGTDTTSRVVVIARDIPKADLEESLQVLLMRRENAKGHMPKETAPAPT